MAGADDDKMTGWAWLGLMMTRRSGSTCWPVRPPGAGLAGCCRRAGSGCLQPCWATPPASLHLQARAADHGLSGPSANVCRPLHHWRGHAWPWAGPYCVQTSCWYKQGWVCMGDVLAGLWCAGHRQELRKGQLAALPVTAVLALQCRTDSTKHAALGMRLSLAFTYGGPHAPPEAAQKASATW